MLKEIKDRIKEIESKNFNASNEEIHELIDLRAELTVKTLWDFKQYSMKTPMQILLEKIKNGDFLNHPKVIGEFIKYNLLEKEKEVIKDAYAEGGNWDGVPQPRFDNWFNGTFNTKDLDS